MPEYSTCSRFSLVQLQFEERKQRAHLKKMSELQRRNGLDNQAPLRFPHIHQGFVAKLNEKRQEIDRENETTFKKLVHIMATKPMHPPPPYHPTSHVRRNQTIHLAQDNAEYRERIAKVKGNYDAREWRKEFEQHKGYLKLSKDNNLFTPINTGINRQRSMKLNSLISSKRTTPSSSTYNIVQKYDQTN